MAKLNVDLSCYAGGRSIITLNFNAVRGGSSNDKCQLRIVRRRTGESDIVLRGIPDFTLRNDKDMFGWTWIDDSISNTAVYQYQLQILRLNSGAVGTFFEMVLNGLHFKR